PTDADNRLSPQENAGMNNVLNSNVDSSNSSSTNWAPSSSFSAVQHSASDSILQPSRTNVNLPNPLPTLSPIAKNFPSTYERTGPY
ncbi:hypothetical protein PoB_006172400, partial [Plakobranchus ocellatus]